MPRPPSKERTEFGEYLMAQLDRKGWDVARLAAESGVAPSSVSRNIYHKRPLPRTILAYAESLGVDYKEMMVAAGYRGLESDEPGQAIHREASRLLFRIPEPLVVALIPMLQALGAPSTGQATLRRVRQSLAELDGETGDDDAGEAQG